MGSVIEQDNQCLYDGTEYQDFIDRLDKHLKDVEVDENRFVPMEERKKESVYTVDNIKNISRGKYKTSWCGVNIMKGPMDMVVMQQLIFREKPGTIIEIGAYTGASAMWFADISKLNNTPCHVFAIDIDISMVDPRARGHANVTFIEGDANKLGDSFPAELLNKLPHPWLISEDAHVDVVGCMEYFHQFMKEGDYFVIEDTNPDMPILSGQCLHEDMGFDRWGLKKHSLLEEFMNGHKETYAVDSYYSDFFGYNGSCNWNGYVRRMK